MVKVRRRKKRRRSHRDEDEDEVLDEEDLDLMLENTGEGTRDTKVEALIRGAVSYWKTS
jgi:transcription elongation factor SPT6